MHKRNTALIALLLAGLVTVGVTMWSSAHRSEMVGIFYFPAILLSVILSGRTRGIGAVAEWSAFLIYTLIYLVAFLIIYAVLLEWFLLRKGFAHLNQYDTERTEGSTSKSAFESLGRAILDVEGRRRSHWLLDNTRSIDLSEPADLLGARVLQGRKLEGPAKGVMNEVKSRLIKERGKVVADALLAKWKADATAHIQQRAAGTEL